MMRYVAFALALLGAACNPVNPEVARVDGAMYSDDPSSDGGIGDAGDASDGAP